VANVLPAARGKQHLLPALETAVREIMDRRGLESGDVMREIGRKPLNPSLGSALHRGTRIQHDLVVALEKWSDDNRTP
jgi:hypothetical protein